MKIDHSAVISSVFELVKTVELDIQLGENSWTTRIELFRDTGCEDYFRCHVWELEMFRLTPTFPQDEWDEPAEVSDDIVMVDRGITHSQLDYSSFIAPNVDVALELIVEDLRRFLEHVTLEKAR